MIKKLILFISIVLFSSSAFCGTARYFNPEYSGGSEDGTYAKPFTTIAQVNAASTGWNQGDDLYFLVGTTTTMDARLKLWGGTSVDQGILGAYYGEGLFGLNGNARPILDGAWSEIITPFSTSGLVYMLNYGGYFTVQDIEVKRSLSAGITMSYQYFAWNPKTIYNTIKNCVVHHCLDQGIIISRGSYTIVENNTVYLTTYENEGESGYTQTDKTPYSTSTNAQDRAGIEVTGMTVEGTSSYNKVRYNTVYNTGEGIGFYKATRYSEIHDNIIYDCKSYHLYISNSRQNKAYNNVVYSTPLVNQPPGDNSANDGRDYLVVINAEANAEEFYLTGDNEIYNNRIAGGYVGIYFENSSVAQGYPYQNNNLVYNNRIVDCDYNWNFHDQPEWEGNLVYDNFSFIFDEDVEGLVQSNDYSPTGVTFSNNFWDPSVTGNAADSENTDSISLLVETNWRSLTPGAVTWDSFAFDTEGDVDPTPDPGPIPDLTSDYPPRINDSAYLQRDVTKLIPTLGN